MKLSLLSLFSIKNLRSFVPLNFINEAIIHDAEVPLAIGVCWPASPPCPPAIPLAPAPPDSGAPVPVPAMC